MAPSTSAAVLRRSGRPPKLSFELWQTAWTLGAGHELKLEITPNDAPTWRADDLPSTVALSHLSLTLPTHS